MIEIKAPTKSHVTHKYKRLFNSSEYTRSIKKELEMNALTKDDLREDLWVGCQ